MPIFERVGTAWKEYRRLHVAVTLNDVVTRKVVRNAWLRVGNAWKKIYTAVSLAVTNFRRTSSTTSSSRRVYSGTSTLTGSGYTSHSAADSAGDSVRAPSPSTPYTNTEYGSTSVSSYTEREYSSTFYGSGRLQSSEAAARAEAQSTYNGAFVPGNWDGKEFLAFRGSLITTGRNAGLWTSGFSYRYYRSHTRYRYSKSYRHYYTATSSTTRYTFRWTQVVADFDRYRIERSGGRTDVTLSSAATSYSAGTSAYQARIRTENTSTGENGPWTPWTP